MGSAFPARAQETKMGTTAAYACEAGCSGPNTLKKRKTSTGSPNERGVRKRVRLSGELAGRIGADRHGRHVLSLRQGGIGAVHRGGGGHDQMGRAVTPRCLQDHHGARGVDLVGSHGVGQGAGHGGPGSQMDDCLCSCHDSIEILVAQNGALHELDGGASRPGSPLSRSTSHRGLPPGRHSPVVPASGRGWHR